MNKIIQTALAALVIGIGSTTAFAGNDRGGHGHSPAPSKPHKPGKHGCGEKCKDDIDIVLKVDRHCDLDIEDQTIALTQQSNGDWKGNGKFSVETNGRYLLKITKPNTLTGPGQPIPVEVLTRQLNGNGGNVQGSKVLETGYHEFQVTASAENRNVRNRQPGWYKGVYKIDVDFSH